MSTEQPIPRGPEDFEQLLSNAGLSERETQAIRSAALSMTANEAARLMGVSPSTVGSYRQRAYPKLGVTTRTEFLALPEVQSWRDQMGRETSCAEAAPQEVPRQEAPETADPDDPMRPGFTRRTVISCLAAVAVLIMLGAVFASHISQPAYASAPRGTLSTPLGEVPDVTGMRADAAASEMASLGLCPEFTSCPDSDTRAGTVIGIGRTGSTAELEGGISCLSWGDGCTAGYNELGDWDGYIELMVSV